MSNFITIKVTFVASNESFFVSRNAFGSLTSIYISSELECRQAIAHRRTQIESGNTFLIL